MTTHRSCPLQPLRLAAALAAAFGLAGPSLLHAQGAAAVLPPATLPVLRGVVAGQAIVQAPAANPGSTGGQRLVIDQSSSRAVIEWKSFDIGSASEVRFNQPDANAAALNRIFSANPSVIQGRLSANGQVLLINQNGILFDRGAQVNVGALLASTLNRSNSDFMDRGLTAGGNSSPAFAGGYDDSGTTTAETPALRSAIRIGAGGDAAASAPQISAAPGGSILVFAPVVENRSGILRSPDGQVMLAAGHKVYLTDANPELQTLRGLVVEISAEDGPVDLTSLVRNLGTLQSDRGNVTLAALAVHHGGRASASTAVLYNGSVYLKAGGSRALDSGTVVADPTGTLTIDKGAVVDTPIDTSDTATMPASQPYASARASDDRRGAIVLSGRQITQLGRVEAPGGRIDISASHRSGALDPTTAQEPARVYFGEQSVTSTAGAWVDVAADSNIVSFRVTGNELKDSPLQKDGVLRGQTVTVDLRQSNPILDLAGYRDSRPKTVGEKAGAGGELTVNSSGSIVARQGSVVDVSGGGWRYGASAPATTQLLGDDGRIYDIGSAPKDRRYTLLLDSFTKTYARWGQTRVWNNLNPGLTVRQPQAEGVFGLDGGRLTLAASNGLVLDGRLLGGTTIGATQLAAAPRGGTLTVGIRSDSVNVLTNAVAIEAAARDTLGSGFAPDTALSEGQTATLTLGASTVWGAIDSPSNASSNAPATLPAGTLSAQRFGSVAINSASRIGVAADVAIDAGDTAQLTLSGRDVALDGRITAAGGTIELVARSSPGAVAGDEAPTVVVGARAALDTAGVWINRAGPGGEPVGAARASAVTGASTTSGVTASSRSTLQGGTVSISGQRVALAEGSVVDVSGGGSVARNARVTGGNAGTVSVAVEALPGAATDSRLDADFRAYAIGSGGTLNLTLPELDIGTGGERGYRFDTSGFDRHGFQRFNLAGTRGLGVGGDARIAPQVLSWSVDPLRATTLPSGGRLADIASAAVLPADQQRSTSVTLRATDSTSLGSVLTVAEGARIETTPGGSVTLQAAVGLDLRGSVRAPGGNVTLTVNGPASQRENQLRVASTATVDASGSFVATPNPLGLRQGTLTAGGTVRIDARNAEVLAEAGARIAVDGIARELDLAPPGPTRAGGPLTVPTTVARDAGSVFVHGEDGVDFRATTSGRAAAGSAGGGFALEIVKREDSTLFTDNAASPRRVTLTQAPVSPQVATSGTDARLNVNTLAASGFDQLRVQSEGAVVLDGAVQVDFARGVRIDTPELVAGGGSTRSSVRGANVVLANSFGSRPLVGGAIDNGEASTPVATTVVPAGGAVLRVEAQTIDLQGDLTINNAARTELRAAGDIRLSGRRIGSNTAATGAALRGSLTSESDLELSAAQVYPSTLSAFELRVAQRDAFGTTTVKPEGRISVAGNGNAAGAVLSAGGAATLRADRIDHQGTLRAPTGTLALDATTSLNLGRQSISSVAADGATVPFGGTESGVSWLYSATNNNATVNDLKAPPEKRIVLSGASVVQQPGATVDLSGGGTLLATEFVPGSGGSRDVTLQPDTFAIIPTARLKAMPVDAHIAALQDIGSGLLTANPDRSVYDSLVIGAGAAVPAGEYVLLPGRYALLPGAYLVQLQTGSAYRNLAVNQTVALPNGQTVVAARRGVIGTGQRESFTVGAVIRPGSQARQESDYNLTSAEFFADRALRERREVPALPADAGRLQVTATNTLALNGTLRAAPESTTARVAEVDIAGSRIAVVGSGQSGNVSAGTLAVEAASVNALGASVLIGGTRSRSDAGTTITTTASDLRVALPAGESLAAPELMLTASDTLTVARNSTITADGKDLAGTTAGPLRADAGGALLRVAGVPAAAATTATSVAPDRSASPDTTRGTLVVESGARIAGSGALVLDATREARVDGSLVTQAGTNVALAAGRISLGDAATGSTPAGLALNNAQLQGVASAASLELKAYERIDLVGAARVGSPTLRSLTLDAPLIAAADAAASATAELKAQTVTIGGRNGSTATGSAVAGGGGNTLDVSGQRIVLGAGDHALAGFGTVTLAASGEVLAQGAGQLRSGGALTVSAARIVGSAGADQRWVAADETASSNSARDVRLQASGGSAATDTTLATGGARIAIEGRRIESNAAIDAASGSVSLNARGGDVVLADGAAIDVSSKTRRFNTTDAAAAAGRITLAAEGGSVRAAAGSTLALNAAPGQEAGRLAVRGDTVTLEGSVSAKADATQAGGRFALDARAADAAALSALNAKLEAGGFDEERTLRLREGDLEIAAGQTVRARRIELTADSGTARIDGTLDARSARGPGRVSVAGATGASLGDAALIDARGSTGAAHPGGGEVRVDALGGTLAMAAGARIDVRDGAGGSERAGRATLTAPRSADNLGIAADLRGTIEGGRAAGAANVAIEARRVYTGNDDSSREAMAADQAAFVGGVDRNTALANLRGNTVLQGAAELRSDGDLRIDRTWDLTAPEWTTAGTAGTLTLRAAGTITLAQSIGLPDDKAPAGASWSLRLQAGQDVVLSNADAKLRSGTGSIEIQAGRDFRIEDPRAVVYTTGVAAAPNPAGTATAPNFAQGVDTPWAKEGGSVRISAGRDAVGAVAGAGQWITDWYRRPRGTAAASERFTGSWWAYRPNFRQNVATFGGGDITIDAGRDISQLSAMSASSGRVAAGTLDVQGGGDVALAAGRHLIGGEVLVARGQGRLSAGGHLGGDGSTVVPTQLYLMGESHEEASRTAQMRVQAGESLALQSIDNPTALGLLASRVPAGESAVPNLGASGGNTRSSFYTYAPTSRIDAVAVGGDLSLGARPADKTPTYSGDNATPIGTSTSAGTAWPAQVRAVALNGTIAGAASAAGNPAVLVAPGLQGLFHLLAARDVRGLNVQVSDLDPAQQPAWNRVSTVDAPSVAPPPASAARIVSRPTGDGSPAFSVQAAGGDVRDTELTLPARSEVRAARDLANVNLTLQNLDAEDLSVVKAETGDIRPGSFGIRIDGPGRLLVQAGRDAALQADTVARGSELNPGLPTAQSARLTIVAGVEGELDLSKLDALYATVIDAGKKNDPEAANAAIEAFFAATQVKAGNIETFRASVQTNGGSDVDLLAPRGNATVGLTSPGQRTIGTVTNSGGAVRSLLEGNFAINAGKVVTAQGGDILIYTSKGNIDAGRGARTSVTVPAPRRVPVTNDAGVVTGYRFVLSGGVAGSGIQTVTSDPDGPGPRTAPPAGSVFLFAPAGFVDAGEAGIASGADIFIVAQVVLNAANISFGGSSSGVPLSAPGSVASTLATSGGSTATNKAAEEAASAAAAATRAAAAAEAPSKPAILSVEVLGFGEKNCKENQRDCFAK